MYPAAMSEPTNSTPNDVIDNVEQRLVEVNNSASSPIRFGYPKVGRDAVVIQPSFDDSTSVGTKGKSLGSQAMSSNQDWQSRSPGDDCKDSINEERSPSSPQKTNSRLSQRHERNLSAHFFDATTLNARDGDFNEDPTEHIYQKDKYAGRKHQRMFSGELSNPPLAHRRINSIGMSETVRRDHIRRHHREDSAGLDILSAAAGVSEEDFEAVTGSVRRSPPRQSTITEGQEAFHPPMDSHVSHDMHPPHPRVTYPNQFGPHYNPQYHQPYAAPTPTPFYPTAPYPTRPIPSHQGYPMQYSQRHHSQYHKGPIYASSYRPDEREMFFDKKVPSPPRSDVYNAAPGHGNHQGSQTFVTAIAVGPSTKMIAPSVKEDAPPQAGHHRKMSSFSSIGTCVGNAWYEPVDPVKGHHRSTSSSVSFLNGFADALVDSTDETFLRNLQASNAVSANTPTPPPDSTSSPISIPQSSSGKLASGGTSKRVRRKCTVEGCENRVVQGGLCIGHGAKRKICNYPGCNKNVKKAGMCSTHGPARKRCDAEGCSKVAVQGGRCIAHGAKKRMCSIPDCTKQAILCGMCKKHHDKASSFGSMDLKNDLCVEVKSPGSSKHVPSHTRGLSFFQEESVETVGKLLAEEDDVHGNQGPSVW